MEVILLQRIPKLGDIGQKVQVKPGFGRNYLIPQAKALAATKANVLRCEAQIAALKQQAAVDLEQAQARAAALEGLCLSITANAGAEGKLFGSVTAQAIVTALADLGHVLEKSQISFSDGPLRHIGDHVVDLQLLGDACVVRLRVSVIAM